MYITPPPRRSHLPSQPLNTLLASFAGRDCLISSAIRLWPLHFADQKDETSFLALYQEGMWRTGCVAQIAIALISFGFLLAVSIGSSLDRIPNEPPEFIPVVLGLLSLGFLASVLPLFACCIEYIRAHFEITYYICSLVMLTAAFSMDLEFGKVKDNDDIIAMALWIVPYQVGRHEYPTT